MSRLTYARKFLLLGLVLLAPAVFALHAYWTTQGAVISFADSERAGLRYVIPANELVVKVTAARSAAVRAASGDADAAAALPGAAEDVRKAVAAVDAADRLDGAAIKTDGVWRKARATVLDAVAAKPADSPKAAYEAYEAAAAAALDARRQGRQRVQADPRSGSRLLLRDGRADHEAAGDCRQRRTRRRSGGGRRRRRLDGEPDRARGCAGRAAVGRGREPQRASKPRSRRPRTRSSSRRWPPASERSRTR